MSRCIVIALVLAFLCGCSTTQPKHTPQPVQLVTEHNNPKLPANKSEGEPIFVALHNANLHYQSEAEATYLKQIASVLRQALVLASKAQNDSDSNSGRIVFDYNAMLLDLQAIQFGINQYFLSHDRSPRSLPMQANDYSVQGNYTRRRD